MGVYSFLRCLNSSVSSVRTFFFVFGLKAVSSFVGAKVIVGKNFHIGKNVRITLGRNSLLRIGDGVSIGEFSRIALAENSKLSIGGNTAFTGFATVYCGKEIIFGKNSAFAVHFFVTDVGRVLSVSAKCIRDRACTYASVSVGEDVWIGAYSAVLPGASIGDHSVVGANSTVTKNIPAFSVCAGSPARVLRRIK